MPTGAVSPTDIKWFEFLRDNLVVDNVNFWTPTPWNIKSMMGGEVFFLLLKSPIRKIGGYGKFVSYGEMSIPAAWSQYGIGNGFKSLDEFERNVKNYLSRKYKGSMIGCIELRDCRFFDSHHYIEPNSLGINIPKQVVKIKYLNEFHVPKEIVDDEFSLVKDAEAKYRQSRSKERFGQQIFRRNVLAAYGGKCCVTGEECADVLDAAHIQEYISEESNAVSNGLCLRTDIHKLFDRGLITINKNYQVEISSSLTSRQYACLRGKRISLPSTRSARPAEAAIEHRMKNVFRP